MTKSSKHNSSIELLRIIAMIIIVFFHFHARNFGMYVFGNERINEEGLLLHSILHHLGGLGVPCFMFISGYYGMKFKKDRLLDIILQCIGYAILSIIGIFVFTGKITLTQLFFFNNWWFILAYTIIYTLSPGINKIIEQFSSRELSMIIGLFYFMMIGSLFNKSASTGGIMTLLTIYLVARWVKLYLTKYQKTIFIYLAIILVFLKFAGVFVAFESHHLGILPYLSSYDNPINIIVAGGMVVAIERIHFSNKLVNTIAANTLAVYLLSECRYGQRLFQPLYEWLPNIPYYLTYFLFSIVIYLICVAVDKTWAPLRQHVCRKICD